MPTTNRPATHCELVEPADLSAVFDAMGIEHLPFEGDRAYVIYGRAILKLIVTDGELSAARTFDVECWDAPADGPDAALASFLDEVRTATNGGRAR